MRLRIIFFVLCAMLMLGLAACGKESLLLEEPKGEQPSTEKADAKGYYGLSDTQVLLITDGRVEETKGISLNGTIYVPMAVAKKWDDRFYWSESEEQLIVSNATQLRYYWPDLNRHQAGEEIVEDAIPQVIRSESVYYVSYELVKSGANIATVHYKEPDRIMTFTDGATLQKAQVQSAAEAQMRTDAAITYPVLAELKLGDSVYYGNGLTENGFTQVVTADGMFGYVKEDVLSAYVEELAVGTLEEPEYTHKKLNETIAMVWHQVFAEQGGSDLQKALKGTTGVNVVSPTWFAVTDVQGNISSLANKSYVQKAHAMGIQVWALVNDFTPGVPGIEVLSSTDARRNLIDSLVKEVERVGADGINVDFEYITVESGPHFIQFLRELYLVCREKGLVLSTDTYVPTAANAFYDLESQRDVVDYICIMAYDEHHGGSQVAGSVASLPFVQNGVSAALKKVPADRLVLGVPFFVRKWSTETADGVSKVSSEAGGMDTLKKFVQKNGGEFVWDDTCKQSYAEFTVDGVLYQVWLEDSESLRYKLNVMRDNKLAGFAGWKLGLESAEVWTLVPEYLQ